MEVTAKLRGARLSAQKARLVADQVRGKPVAEALDLLTFSPKKAAQLVKKCFSPLLQTRKKITAWILTSCVSRPSASMRA